MGDKLDQHDLVVAAADGFVEDVKAYLKRGVLEPDDVKCTRALYLAAKGGHIAVVRVLMDGKVPPNPTFNTEGKMPRSALHVAAESGNQELTRLLLDCKALVSSVDPVGSTPLDLLLKMKPAGMLDVVRELIRFGAEVPPDVNVPGLAAVVSEMKSEAAANMLREMAAITFDPAALVDMEDKVWLAQREHMRYLAMREEQKAGLMLIEREERLKAELVVMHSCEEEAAKGNTQVRDLQVQDQMLAQDLENALREIEPTRLEEAHARAEYERFGSEIFDRRKEANAALSARDLSLSEHEKSAQELEAAQMAHGEMETQVDQAKRDRDIMKSELETARNTLNNWMQAKEQAASLTMQAHKILHP